MFYRKVEYFGFDSRGPEELKVSIYKDADLTEFGFSVSVINPSSDIPTYVFRNSPYRIGIPHLMTELRNVLAFMDHRDWKRNCEHYEDLIFDLR